MRQTVAKQIKLGRELTRGMPREGTGVSMHGKHSSATSKGLAGGGATASERTSRRNLHERVKNSPHNRGQQHHAHQNSKMFHELHDRTRGLKHAPSLRATGNKRGGKMHTGALTPTTPTPSTPTLNDIWSYESGGPAPAITGPLVNQPMTGAASGGGGTFGQFCNNKLIINNATLHVARLKIVPTVTSVQYTPSGTGTPSEVWGGITLATLSGTNLFRRGVGATSTPLVTGPNTVPISIPPASTYSGHLVTTTSMRSGNNANIKLNSMFKFLIAHQ